MSEIKVNKITPKQNCTQVTLGDSGDTFVIPSGVTITNNGTQTGFGRTGTVDWDTTAKTASFTAVSGVGYFVNTTSGAITVTLPAGSAGSIVSLKDYANTWNTNNVTLTPNGTDKINGANASAILETQDQSVTLVYVDSTKGWRAVQDSTSDVTGGTFISATGGTITCCGDYKIHTFTGPGTFCVSSLSNVPANNEVSYMVVAGGGGGGTIRGGGGGAGGFRESKSGVDCYSASPLEGATPITVTASPYPISVGGGGSGNTSPNNLPTTQATAGAPSTFSTITSVGGGFGGNNTPCAHINGTNGGSGGGGSGQFTAVGGTGNTPPVSPPQGNNGGNDTRPGSPPGEGGAGGGGATAVGVNSISANAGCGGAGATTSISASPVAYAGGGGGGTTSFAGACAGAGGTGGGGTGGDAATYNGTNGTTNTGGGGGGSGQTPSPNTGGNGGSGIVIIRYKYQ
jgi:hypothetical protein